MTSRLPSYEGDYPASQEDAEAAARRLVEAADGRLTSRQALAVLRVAVDAIEALAKQVESLSVRIQDLEEGR